MFREIFGKGSNRPHPRRQLGVGQQRKRCGVSGIRNVLEICILGSILCFSVLIFLHTNAHHHAERQSSGAGGGGVPKPEAAGPRRGRSSGASRPAADPRHGQSTFTSRALGGARRGRFECDADTNGMSYWNDPQDARDRNFRSPFSPPPGGGRERYVTFEPDAGGWNNLRMSLENIIVFAAASGRTLVLPPDQPIYLMKADKKNKYRGFGDFFNLHTEAFNRIVPVITTKEFIAREGGRGGRLPIPDHLRAGVHATKNKCELPAKSERSCSLVYEYYMHYNATLQLEGTKNCLIFDERRLASAPDVDPGSEVYQHRNERALKICNKRKAVYYDATMRDAVHLHFNSHNKTHRMLTQFYAFMLFLDPAVDHFFKRLVRDHLRYRDAVFCAASKVVTRLRGEGGGSFSSLHVRRGDFQWKGMRISAEEWLENTRGALREGEVLYISTDEQDRKFFAPLDGRYRLRFLTDFPEATAPGSLSDPNFQSMIEVLVASQGRHFVGTYFSSFSAYIGRLRGYKGIDRHLMTYSHLERMNATHEFVWPKSSYSAREFPLGWVGIDGDEEINGFL